MLPKCVIGTRALLVRVTLIIVALAVLPASDPALAGFVPTPTGEPALAWDTAAAVWDPASAGFVRLNAAPADAADQATMWGPSSTGSIDNHVLNLALGAANCAVRSGAVTDPSTLTVIDYSKPSTAKRLWVFDLRSRELMYEELVAHGQGSGGNLPTEFSNEPETHRTSLGLFVTDDTYVGKNGYSLRLDGLDRGFNDRARERAIVMHGAPYVSEQFAEAQGRLGRSWGCPALRETIARDVINLVKGGGLVFAYYPDPEWLTSSQYLGDCAAAR